MFVQVAMSSSRLNITATASQILLNPFAKVTDNPITYHW